MKTTQEQLIKKQKELINRFLKGNLQIHPNDYSDYQKLRDEIFALEKLIEEETEPVTISRDQVLPEDKTTFNPDSLKPNRIELTDEEIIDYALNYISHKDLKPANKGLIKDALIIGAKWYRNQIEVLIMNELVKFLKWFRGHEDLNELVVEDYLKPKNQ
jgi:hypothetical protein